MVQDSLIRIQKQNTHFCFISKILLLRILYTKILSENCSNFESTIGLTKISLRRDVLVNQNVL